MSINRRTLLGAFSAAAAGLAGLGNAAMGVAGSARAQEAGGRRNYRRIATEEAFSIPEVAEALGHITRTAWDVPGMRLLDMIYGEERPPLGQRFRSGLLDLAANPADRLQTMDAHGVDMHLLSLTSPGVQMFDADTAVSLARVANDRLADWVRQYPDRFAGLATFAPQDPERAVQEMERAVNTLGLNGFVVNSHTNDEYLDERKYWPILEAAEALNAPLYIHPRAPSAGMVAPFQDYNLTGAVWGYGMETGTHAVRLMMSGVLDQFPDLTVVLGHMGEAVPFWLWRLDFMGAPSRGRANKRLPSAYFDRNFMITTSGVEDPIALRYCIEKIGADRIMWAIDYPYQTTEPAVRFMNEAPISEKNKAAIFHGNAERVFGIKAA